MENVAKKCEKKFGYFPKTTGITFNCFYIRKTPNIHDGLLDWSCNRAFINSKFHFLSANETLPHFLQMSGKTFNSFVTERLITYIHHCDSIQLKAKQLDPWKEHGFLFFLVFCLEKIHRKVVPWFREIIVKVILSVLCHNKCSHPKGLNNH